jgi:hypothetical protein
LEQFNICGYDAILLNGKVEVSAPNEDAASKIVVKLKNALLQRKISELRINLPNKIAYVVADKEYPGDLLFWAREHNDKKFLN